MSASFLSVSSFSVPKNANRATDAEFFIALIKLVATWVTALAKKIPGIKVFSGNNSTMSTMCSALVLEI